MDIEKKEINGRLRTVGTVEIEYEGKTEKVGIMKLNFGEDLSIRNRNTKVKLLGGQPDVKIDQENLTLENLNKAIVEAPFELNIESIKMLDKDVATELLEAFNELNNPSKKKDEN